MDTMQVQVVLGAVFAYILQWLKGASWFPLLTESSTTFIKVLWSAILAAFTALGLSYSYDPTLGVLAIGGLTWSHVGQSLVQFLFALIVQHGSYELLVKPGTLATVKLSPAAMADILKKTGGALLLVALSVGLVGCAPSFKAKLQQVDRSVQGALYTLDQTENELFKAGQVTPAWHKQFSGYMVTALTTGQTFHRSVMTYKPGQKIPIDVIQLAAALRSAADLVGQLPPSDVKSKIAAVLNAAAYVANDLLVLVLPQQAANDLLPPTLVWATEGGL
jgi:hypothetical protein